MKNLFLLLVMFALVIVKGVSEESNRELEVEDRLYKTYLEETIPEKFVEPFFEMTKKSKSIGIEILGLGFHESEWKNFVGKVNKNGSIDIGPLMLNSYNIANEEFMRRYGKYSDEYKYDTDVYYMTICITFFKALRVEYGTFNALKVYNGGPRVMKSSCSSELRNTVTTYANVVYKQINRCYSEWSEFKEEKRSIIIAQIEEEERTERLLVELKDNFEKTTSVISESSHSPEPNQRKFIPSIKVYIITRKENLYYKKNTKFIERRYDIV